MISERFLYLIYIISGVCDGYGEDAFPKVGEDFSMISGVKARYP